MGSMNSIATPRSGINQTLIKNKTSTKINLFPNLPTELLLNINDYLNTDDRRRLHESLLPDHRETANVFLSYILKYDPLQQFDRYKWYLGEPMIAEFNGGLYDNNPFNQPDYFVHVLLRDIEAGDSSAFDYIVARLKRFKCPRYVTVTCQHDFVGKILDQLKEYYLAIDEQMDDVTRYLILLFYSKFNKADGITSYHIYRRNINDQGWWSKELMKHWRCEQTDKK